MAASVDQTTTLTLGLQFVSNHKNNETLMTCGKQRCSNRCVASPRAGKCQSSSSFTGSHSLHNIHISVLLRGIYKNTQPWHSVVLNTNNPYIDLRQGANIWVRGFKPLVHGPLLAYNPLESGPKLGCQ